MVRLFTRSGWLALVVLALLLPAGAQVDVRWIQASPAESVWMDISPAGRWMTFGQYFNTLVYSLPDRQLVRVLRGAPARFVGSRLLAVRTDKGLELRDMPSFRLVKRLNAGAPLQASRDGKYMLTSAGEIQLWQVTPPRLIYSYIRRYSESVALTADGRLLFVLRDSGMIEVRSTADGRLVRQFSAVDTGDLAVSPTGDRFAIVSARQVAVCRGDNGQLLYSFATDYWPPFVMQFSPDGNYLAAGYGMYYETGWWRLWRLSDGALVAGETYPFTSENEVWTLAFSHDSARLYMQFPYRTEVVDTHTGATVEEWHHPSNRVLGFVANDAWLAVANREGISLYSVADGSLARRYVLSHMPVTNVISPDGRVYVNYPYNDGITVFRLNDEGSVSQMLSLPLFPQTDLDEPRYFQMNTDGSRLFVLDTMDRLYSVDVAGGSPRLLAERVKIFDIVPDGSLAVTLEDEVRVRRVPDGVVVRSFPAGDDIAVLDGGRSLLIAYSYSTTDTYATYRLLLHDLQTDNLLRDGFISVPKELSAYGGLHRHLRVSANAEVIAVTVAVPAEVDKRTDVYTWNPVSGEVRLVARWRDGFGGQTVHFGRNSNQLAIAGRTFFAVADNSYAGTSSLYLNIWMDGWLGETPEHLRYTVRSPQKEDCVDPGYARSRFANGRYRRR
ncbi:MAG: hypothetical protein HPY54_16190 [Chthonomonadetes bacterium]|nr:hypothetical protein [Chthonomonadetes bacterium]